MEKEHRNEYLLIKGARQVGKSYVVKRFGEAAYRSFIDIDFIRQPELVQVFEGSLSADEIYSRLSLYLSDIQIIPSETLIFLDEIQECPNARAALKYLAQDGRCDVIASGSLLEIRFRQLKHAPSLPVGYERQVIMHPLDFEEYLWACGYDDGVIRTLRGYLERMEPIPQAVHEKMMRILREYLAIGGMPAVVDAFMTHRDFNRAFGVQEMLHGCISMISLAMRSLQSALKPGPVICHCRASSLKRTPSSSIRLLRNGVRAANSTDRLFGLLGRRWCCVARVCRRRRFRLLPTRGIRSGCMRTIREC